MTRSAGRGRWLTVLLVAGGLAGCKGMFGSQGPPEDPLFFDKKPLQTKAASDPPVVVRHVEPAAPVNPYAPADLPGVAGKQRPSLAPGILTHRPHAVDPEEEDEP